MKYIITAYTPLPSSYAKDIFLVDDYTDEKGALEIVKQKMRDNPQDFILRENDARYYDTQFEVKKISPAENIVLVYSREE